MRTHTRGLAGKCSRLQAWRRQAQLLSSFMEQSCSPLFAHIFSHPQADCGPGGGGAPPRRARAAAAA